MRRHACVGLFAVAAAVLLACDDQGPRTPADIVIAPNLPHVPMGETLQLTATVVDAEGRAIPDEPVSFESSDPSILTVSENGLLTSVGPRGTSTIRAVSGDLSAEVEAEVVLGPSGLFVSPASLDLESDGTVLLNVTVTDEHGDSIPDAEVAFQTSDFVVAPCSPTAPPSSATTAGKLAGWTSFAEPLSSVPLGMTGWLPAMTGWLPAMTVVLDAAKISHTRRTAPRSPARSRSHWRRTRRGRPAWR